MREVKTVSIIDDFLKILKLCYIFAFSRFFIEASDFGKMSLRSRFEPVMLRREGRKKEFGGY
jgi:hypothetical protein